MLLNPEAKGLHLLGLRPTGDLGPLTGYTSKRGKAVWFLKAPPKTPPTCWQTAQRNAFRMVANVWKSLPPDQRTNWTNLAKYSSINITGYNLFTWYLLRPDQSTIHTLEHQTGIQVISVPP